MIDMIEKYALPEKSDAPKYLLVRDLMIRAISDGYWRPGDRLPTEQEIAAALPFSLGTVQRAYAKLVEEGLVIRERGRGSFVTRTPEQMREPWHCRFLDKDNRRFLAVYPRIIDRKLIAASDMLRRTLAIEGRSEKVLRIDRVINIGQEFEVQSRFYCSARLFPSLAERRLADLETANFKAVLLNDYSLPVVDFRQYLSTISCPEAIAAEIGFEAGEPCTLLEAVAFTGDDAPVYYQELFIPPTRYRLVIESHYNRSAS